MKADDIDEMLGTPARLAVVSTLVDSGQHTFSQLKSETGLADGNLHVQTRKLKDAGYLECQKIQQGSRRVTSFQITELGRNSLKKLVRQLSDTIKDSQKSGSGRNSSKDDSVVW